MISSLPQEPPVVSASRCRFIVSWWDREVHVWVLKRTATSILNAGDEDIDISRNRRLLKTIVVKGDSNITSVTINPEGTFLVVSTSTDVKAFRLRHQQPDKPADLKLSTVKLPPQMTALGASHVKLSPDGRWLFGVREGGLPFIVNIDSPTNDLSNVHVPKLRRLRRNIPGYLQRGGLGKYDRIVTHITFTADSQMVATADLAGYIDTWVLRDQDESAAPDRADHNDDDASSSSESDSSEDEQGAAVAGQQWIRNPRGRLLPKLSSSPVVLSFSDNVPGSKNGDGASADDYTLLAITSGRQLSVFHPRQGSMTMWSRRHPVSNLPAPIRGLLDLAKGVIWQGHRAWIYGISFLYMIDMSQDLPKSLPSTEVSDDVRSKKRKRNGATTGAGGKMARGNTAPHSVQKHADGKWEEMDLDDEPPVDDTSSEAEADDVAKGEELLQLRENGGDTALTVTNGNTELLDSKGEKKSWWMTHKYRPIFGIIPLSKEDESLEVALVERPTWDVEMVERYYVPEEWER